MTHTPRANSRPGWARRDRPNCCQKAGSIHDIMLPIVGALNTDRAPQCSVLEILFLKDIAHFVVLTGLDLHLIWNLSPDAEYTCLYI